MLHASPSSEPQLSSGRPWYRDLNSYHWFVLTVCTLGWMFDCLDQQLFNAERKPAISELMNLPANDPIVDRFAGYSTSILLIGWATGGIAFGIMGDRIGRAQDHGVHDPVLLRVHRPQRLLGLGLGFHLISIPHGAGRWRPVCRGSFPRRGNPARPRRTPALGMLQALSAIGNVSAALIVMLFEHMAAQGILPQSAWRWIFGVGIVPALLSVIVMLRLKEPQRWQKAVAEGEQKYKAGSVAELFGDPRWRRNTIVGMILASAGVIGLWGIGVFSNDLTHTIFSKRFDEEARQKGEAELDLRFVRQAIESPAQLDGLAAPVSPVALLELDPLRRDTRSLYAALLTLKEKAAPVTVESVLALLDQPPSAEGSVLESTQPNRVAQSAADRKRRAELLAGADSSETDLAGHATRINKRFKEINGRLGFWRSINLMFFNIGAFFGIYAFSVVTQRIGRRPAFAIFFLAAMFSTAAAFWWMDQFWHLFVMVPLMGFFQLSVFGGYAIYFPELFPTRLRSTGTSFCYNIARFVAALGPAALGMLSSGVFGHTQEPIRYAGVTMSAIFLLGILVLPFAPETKDQPLPE